MQEPKREIENPKLGKFTDLRRHPQSLVGMDLTVDEQSAKKIQDDIPRGLHNGVHIFYYGVIRSPENPPSLENITKDGPNCINGTNYWNWRMDIGMDETGLIKEEWYIFPIGQNKQIANSSL